MADIVELKRRIEDGSAVVGIVGLGYVGLPLALAFVERGFSVLGFDVDPERVQAINDGICPIRHLDSTRVKAASSSGRLTATTELDRLAQSDAILICVPTPLTSHREPDMRYVESTGREIAARLRPGQLIVLESTTYPGTTEELLLGILEESGLECGRDFLLAFSPEREDPGNADYGTSTIPKVVGGVEPAAGEVAALLYGQVVERVVEVSSASVAEAAKLTENVFRAVNIALVNELKVIYDRMGIDVWEVLDAAETKPFGFMRFNPGPGWGGHCIPLDPFYLAWKAREHGQPTRFIELAGEINVDMPRWVVRKLQDALNESGKAVKGSRVLVLGLAYKRDIDDPRESPAFEIMDLLLQLGAEVAYHDPHISQAPPMRSWPDLPTMPSQPLTDDYLRHCDVAIVVTDHSDVDYERVRERVPLVVDTRSVYRDAPDRVVKACPGVGMTRLCDA